MRQILPVVLTALLFLPSAPLSAQDLQLTMENGRVTLIAADVPVRQILAEWARVGETTIVNAEKLAGPPLTLHLVDVPEGQALDTVLRSASGYMAAPRAAGAGGRSAFDRIMILPVSRAPAHTAVTAPPPAFTRQPPPPPPVPVEDDDMAVAPEDDIPVPPEAVPQQLQPVPGAPHDPGTPDQPVLTSPRPGMLPVPGVPGNPYIPGQQPGQQGTPGQIRTPVQPGQPRPVGGSDVR